ncbi:TonB-dependent receptor domain-containing protein [Hyphococcus sp.]|uniref:TonB-dependent receptor domain-containing protein n=1 Tax=Hyphococcus sp. TaxID=2038636 RepID=UPI003CCC2F2E
MKSYLSSGSVMLASAMFLPPLTANAQDATSSISIQPTIGDEIVVRGRNIPDPQRATSAVATFLSEEDLDRTGDDTAAEALKRLSGLSVVGGKFAYVRGLGDRYSSARLNGSPLPSPEPLRRTVPLDLFPSNILGGATVQKTYSSNYPGEFGGGIIDLQTIRDPGESFLNVKLGVGINTFTTAHEGIFVRGGDRDWLGYDDGTRDIPAPLATVIDNGQVLADLSDAEVETIGESLTNSPLNVIQSGNIGPNFEGTIDGGFSRDFSNGMTFGFVGVAGYKQDWKTEEALKQVAADDAIRSSYNSVETSLDVTVNALGSGSLEWDNHGVTATALYIHSTRKEAQIEDGFDFNAPGDGFVFDESSSFLERQLAMAQLTGDHIFGDLEINWQGALARSERDSPYERSLRRFKDTVDGAPLYSFANNNSIAFSDLVDDSVSGGIELLYNVPISGAREIILSGGYEYSDQDREFNYNEFQFAGISNDPDFQMARPDFLFSPDNIDPARLVLIDLSTQGSESYQGDLLIHAGYAQAELELIPAVRTTVGVRYEDAVQTVNTFARNGNTGPGANLENDYFLPSATVTWNFTDNMQLRLGYSHTLARPQFRELSPSQFVDLETDRTYRGSEQLVDSEFRNYDARYEYYLGRNQFITLAGFYKEIENPIEEILYDESTFSYVTTFINSPKADLYGGEFEYRTRFGIPWSDWFDRREWLFSVNYTYTKSEIKVAAGDQIIDPFSGAPLDASLYGLEGAPLQGTPEHIANAQFGWEDEDDQLTVLFGWVDERILQRGDRTGGVSDVIEKPGMQLDVVYRQDIIVAGSEFTIGLSARNLLGAEHEEFQLSDATASGRSEFNTYKRGRSLSASLTARF